MYVPTCGYAVIYAMSICYVDMHIAYTVARVATGMLHGPLALPGPTCFVQPLVNKDSRQLSVRGGHEHVDVTRAPSQVCAAQRE